MNFCNSLELKHVSFQTEVYTKPMRKGSDLSSHFETPKTEEMRTETTLKAFERKPK